MKKEKKCWNCGNKKDLTSAHLFRKIDGKRIGRTLTLCRTCHNLLDGFIYPTSKIEEIKTIERNKIKEIIKTALSLEFHISEFKMGIEDNSDRDRRIRLLNYLLKKIDEPEGSDLK